MIGSDAVAEVLARLSKAEAQFRRTQARPSKARAKCAQELQGLSRSHASSPAWASGGIVALVGLCHDPASADDAVRALSNLSAAKANRATIVEAGAIPSLVALLCGVLCDVGWLGSEATEMVVRMLWDLDNIDASKAAIIEPGAIPRLVALLGGGPASVAAGTAAAALSELVDDDADKAATIEAGAIPPLVALLTGGPESEAAQPAARML